MTFRRLAFLLLVLACPCRLALPQTIETQKKPPSVVFKDAAGNVVTPIPVDTKQHMLMVNMEISTRSNAAYVLNAAGKSKERSISAVNLATQRVDRVIQVGAGEQVELLMSEDGRRLFCYILSGVHEGSALEGGRNQFFVSAHLQKADGSSSITVIDTTSNEIVGTYALLHNPGVVLPKARWIESFLSATSAGDRIIVRVVGSTRDVTRPTWQRLAVFSAQSPNSPLIIDPGKPNRHERPPTFLGGTPPSNAGSKEGIWVLRRGSLRFMSEGGGMGDEFSLPPNADVAAMPSLDEAFFFLGAPDSSQHSGALEVVDIAKGTKSSRALSDVPITLKRLGSGKGLWLMGSQEMRPISETGELGDRRILLNNPHEMEEGDESKGSLFLDGYPGETISLGEDHAAVLITDPKGKSAHRVALLNLRQFQLESIVTTMSSREQARIMRHRWLMSLAEAAAQGAIAGTIEGLGYMAPPGLYNVSLPSGLTNEALAAGPEGRNLYVLDADLHAVTVIDVQTGAAAGRIPVDKSVTAIQVAPDSKHLICYGTGFLQTIDLESTKMAN